ncbi:hypothetical protein D6833_13260 [Candidatus Parcubacteria bacterium]|nr:MAG: hypothetical protein D6833_13260 [Candidatus Parcubacteria bacterium]
MAKEKFVLDSFAILCLLSDTSGSESVHRLLERGKRGECQLFMNVVNLAEVTYIVQRQEGPERA